MCIFASEYKLIVKTAVPAMLMEAFIEALERHVADAIRGVGDMEYCMDAVEIVDARNHIFRNRKDTGTDEELSTFALRDLCRLDGDTMLWRVDRKRLHAVARDFF